MWLLVQVARGNKFFDPETRVENRVLICDTSELVISGRMVDEQSYRFEARKGTENYSVAEFTGLAAGQSLVDKFGELAQRLDAVGAPVRR